MRRAIRLDDKPSSLLSFVLMTKRELFFQLMKGQGTPVVPFFPDISDWYKVRRLPLDRAHEIRTGSFMPDDAPFHRNSFGMPPEFADWTYLDFYRNSDWGLPVHIYDWCNFTYRACEEARRKEGDRIIHQFTTPLGTIQRIDGMAADGSLCPLKYFVSCDDDWKVLLYVLEHTEPIPDYERITQILDGIGKLGVADIVLWRSPFGKILTEYAGLETTVYQLVDKPSVISDLLKLQTQMDLDVVRLAAESPADIVILSDHADEQLINPVWYDKYCMPFCLRVSEILHGKGKIFSTHLDGNFKALFPLVARSGFDLLDGCTPAPMTNYEVEELESALSGGMKAYCGVPSIFFTQNADISEITAFAERIINALAGKVILNIGDILPADGDVQKAIELGRWVARINRRRLNVSNGTVDPQPTMQSSEQDLEKRKEKQWQ
ncbi:MAG: uroporphyrinogen decarboxylase family protein [bacterium]|nr:uroporphyrinogen decarboxylase family protein [bacterium]